MNYHFKSVIYILYICLATSTLLVADDEVRKEYERRRNSIGWNAGPQKWRELVTWLESQDPGLVDQSWMRECREWVSDLELKRIRSGDFEAYFRLAEEMREYGGRALYRRVLIRSLNRHSTYWRLAEKVLEDDRKDMGRVLDVYYNAIERKCQKSFNVEPLLNLAKWCETNKTSSNSLESWSEKCYKNAAKINMAAARKGSHDRGRSQNQFVEKTLQEISAIINSPFIKTLPSETEVPTFLPDPEYMQISLSEFQEDLKYRVVTDGEVSLIPYKPIKSRGYDEVWDRVSLMDSEGKKPEGSRSRLSTSQGRLSSRNSVWRKLKWDSRMRKWVIYTSTEMAEAHRKKIKFAKKVTRQSRKEILVINQVKRDKLNNQTQEIEILKQWIAMEGVPGRLITELRKKLNQNAHAIHELMQTRKDLLLYHDAWKEKLQELEYEQP